MPPLTACAIDQCGAACRRTRTQPSPRVTDLYSAGSRVGGSHTQPDRHVDGSAHSRSPCSRSPCRRTCMRTEPTQPRGRSVGGLASKGRRPNRQRPPAASHAPPRRASEHGARHSRRDGVRTAAAGKERHPHVSRSPTAANARLAASHAPPGRLRAWPVQPQARGEDAGKQRPVQSPIPPTPV
jgi:hypothetical protein